MKVCLITRRMPPARCGIGDYTLGLAASLSSAHEVIIVTGVQEEIVDDPRVRILPVVPDWGPRGMRVLLKTLRELQPDWILVEYVPFLYSRIGVNFWLPLAVCWMRLAGMRVLLTVHEPFVEIDSLKHAVMGPAQRLMIWLLILGSTKVAVTTSRWTRLIAPFASRTRMFCAPVASPFPNVAMTADERACLRADLGIGPADIVVATLRPTGAGKLWASTLGVWTRLRETHAHAKLLVIGVTDEEWQELGDVPDMIPTGYVSPERASRLLSCADVFIALFVDGVSTRRTSVMAAMAHGLPIVTTGSPFTDAIFESSPIATRAPGNGDGILADLDELMRQPEVRKKRGRASREFYVKHFDWPVLADRLCAELGERA